MAPRLTLPPVLPATMIDACGTPVALRRHGVGPPLLYLHGAGMTGKWLRLHEALAQEMEVIAPEHPGCGGTPAAAWVHDIADLVVHYDDLCRVLGLDEPFDLVGYSLGGWLAAEFAVAYPRLIRSLTLIAPVGLAVAGRPALRVDPFAVTPQERAAALFNDFHEVGAAAARPSTTAAAIREHAENAVYARLMWQRPYSLRLPRLLRRVSCPALILTGWADRYVDPGVARRYQSLLPDARLVGIEGAGHALVLERPDEVATAVLDFTRTRR